MAPALPAWYSGVVEFGYFFYNAASLLFIIVGFLIVGAVSRPGWRHHLRWAFPAVAASVLTGIYRLLLDLHHYLHVGGLAVYAVADRLHWLSDGISLYAVWTLWRTLRDLAHHPASTDPLALHPAQTGVWPPPPTGRP